MDETLATTAPFALCRFLSAMDPGVVDRQGAVGEGLNLHRQPPAPAKATSRKETTAEPRRMAMGRSCPPGRCTFYCCLAMGCC